MKIASLSILLPFSVALSSAVFFSACGAAYDQLPKDEMSRTNAELDHSDGDQSRYQVLYKTLSGCLDGSRSEKECAESIDVTKLIPIALSKSGRSELVGAFDRESAQVECTSKKKGKKCEFCVCKFLLRKKNGDELKIATARHEPAKKLIFKGSTLFASFRLYQNGGESEIEICETNTLEAQKRSFPSITAKVLGARYKFRGQKMVSSQIFVDALGEKQFPTRNCQG